MGLLKRMLRRWGVSLITLVLLVCASGWTVVEIYRQMQVEFQDRALLVSRTAARAVSFVSKENRAKGDLEKAVHALVLCDESILRIRYCVASPHGFSVLLDTMETPHRFASIPSAKISSEAPYSIKPFVSGGRQLAEVWVPVPEKEGETSHWISVLVEQKHGFNMSFAVVVIAGFLFLFTLFVGYFIWQYLWLRGELRARQNAEIALSRKSRIDEIFARYSRSLILAGSVEEASWYVLEAAVELTGSRMGYAGYMDAATGHLICPVGSGLIDPHPERRPDPLELDRFSGVWGDVLRRRQPVMATAAAGRVLGIPTRDGLLAVQNLLSVPAMEGAILMGQITLGDSRRPYTESDLRVMEKLADLFAISIRKILTVSALRESEQRFRVVFKTSPDAIVLTRMGDKVLVDVNDGFERMSGYCAQEVRGRSSLDLGFWTDPGVREEIFAALSTKQSVENLETELRNRKGKASPVLISAATVLLRGEAHLLAVVREIAHIKKTEAELRKERGFLSKVVETSPAGIIAADKNGQILFVNQKISQIFDLDAEQILARTVHDARWEITCHDLRPVPAEELVFHRVRNEKGPVYDIRHAVMNGAGERIYLSVNAATLWQEDGSLDMIVAALEDVSERVMAERSLTEARGRLDSLLANLPVILWAFDSKGCITFFEGKGTQGLRIPAGGMEGVSLFARYEENPVIGEMARRLLTGEAVAFTTEIKERFYEINAAPLRDGTGEIVGASGVASDVSLRVRAEVDRVRLSAAMEQVAESILVTDIDGIIQYVNPAFERITGWSREEAVGKTPRILKSGLHGRGFYQKMWETLTNGRVWKGYITNRNRDGVCYDEEVNISPIMDQNGEIMNFVAVKRDVSVERGLERQLRQAQKMEAIGTLAGGIAHDFNNILFPIIGFTELAIEIVASDRTEHRYLKSILSAAHRAKDLVWQILTFSRQSESEKRPVQVRPIVKEALKLLRASIPSTIEIRHGLDGTDAMVMADPTRIHQVVMNLCTNAFQAMETAGGVMEVRLQETKGMDPGDPDTARTGAGPWLLLTVSDTGYGMDAETMERIFDPYFTTKEQGKGTGLGLATVHGIIAGYGGEIRVESRLDAGTCFFVYLPVFSDPDHLHKGRPASDVPAGTERILLVDDEEAIVLMMGQMLESFGYQVTAFTSSTEALQAFCDAPDAFDLILTDHTMPHLTGMDLAAKVHATRPEVPILMCSGFSEVMEMEAAREYGVVDCLMKPVVRRDLAVILRQTLDESKVVGSV